MWEVNIYTRVCNHLVNQVIFPWQREKSINIKCKGYENVVDFLR